MLLIASKYKYKFFFFFLEYNFLTYEKTRECLKETNSNVLHLLKL